MKTIIEKAKQYKRKIAGGYISISSDDINSKITGERVFVSTKIDGEFNILSFDGTTSVLVNGNGKIKDDLPVLKNATDILKANNIKALNIAVELHINDKRCRVFEVMSAISSDEKSLVISAFDILDIDDEEYVSDDYEHTILKLQELFKGSEQVNPVSLETVNSKEVGKLYKREVTDNGKEGLVVRMLDNPIVYKIKPIHTLDVAVIGFTQGDENKIRELLVALKNKDDSFVQVGKVGTGLNEELKSELYETLNNIIIDSSYIEVDKRRIAFALVKPTIVVEITINELLTENTKGKIKNSLLNYNEVSGYKFITNINGTSLLHPVFKRIRDDKSVNTHDVRYKQVTDIVFIDHSETKVLTMQLPKSEIIFREVYTKTSKGKTNVLKFIAWKTNKENLDTSYPAYVMNYTNFSPTRGEPLKKDVRISSDKKQILGFVQSFKDKNVKKGWNLVE